MSSTMLSFFPDEVSRIEGPLARRGTLNGQRGSLLTKKLDFRDLPCPPQSIMVNPSGQFEK